MEKGFDEIYNELHERINAYHKKHWHYPKKIILGKLVKGILEAGAEEKGIMRTRKVKHMLTFMGVVVEDSEDYIILLDGEKNE